jgi:hypothetical protein
MADGRGGVKLGLVKDKAFQPGQGSARVHGALVFQARGGMPTPARRDVDVDGMAHGVTVALVQPLQENGMGGPRLAKGGLITVVAHRQQEDGREGRDAHRLASQMSISVRWRVDAGESGPCRTRGYDSVDVRA